MTKAQTRTNAITGLCVYSFIYKHVGAAHNGWIMTTSKLLRGRATCAYCFRTATTSTATAHTRSGPEDCIKTMALCIIQNINTRASEHKLFISAQLAHANQTRLCLRKTETHTVGTERERERARARLHNYLLNMGIVTDVWLCAGARANARDSPSGYLPKRSIHHSPMFSACLPEMYRGSGGMSGICGLAGNTTSGTTVSAANARSIRKSC